ncbi:MAG: hypothetical protein AB4426_12140 [Xenococcaceae cyanobacterium]
MRIKFEWNNSTPCPNPLPNPSFDRNGLTVEAQPGKKTPFSIPRIPIPRIPIPRIPRIPIPRIPVPRI